MSGRRPRKRFMTKNFPKKGKSQNEKNLSIIHFPITIENYKKYKSISNVGLSMEKAFLDYKPMLDEPKPYEFSPSEVKCYMVLEKNEKVSENDHDINISPLMKQFRDGNTMDMWPSKTKIHCFWCCHPFQSIPVGLPQRRKQKYLTMTGCFCSPECAAAYNFNDTLSTDDIWERYALLNEVFISPEKNQFIRPALPRECLQIFGGFLHIDKFREHNKLYHAKKTFIIMTPHMRSTVPAVEEISLNIENNFKEQFQQESCFDKKKNAYRIKRPEKKNKENTVKNMMMVRTLQKTC